MTDKDHAVSYAASILRLAGAELTDEALESIHGLRPFTLEDMLEQLFPPEDKILSGEENYNV